MMTLLLMDIKNTFSKKQETFKKNPDICVYVLVQEEEETS